MTDHDPTSDDPTQQPASATKAAPAGANRSASPDDLLPPVEPPSVGLLLQLFVVPGIIVAIIVSLYWGVNQLAHGQADPEAELQKIVRKNNGSWQAASNLADQLRNPADTEIRRNVELAKKIASLLEGEIDADRHAQEDIALRYFLCRALGEFELPDVTPTLLKAAATGRTEEERQVRLAALEALTLHAGQEKRIAEQPGVELLPTFLSASRDAESSVRSRAAFGLGVLSATAPEDHADAEARLKELLFDPYPDVRFNAATHLARAGDMASLDVVREMLNPDKAALQDEEKSLQDGKRQLIVVNGIRSATHLMQAHPAETAPLRQAVQKLTSDPALSIRMESEKSLQLGATPAKKAPAEK